MKATVYKSTGSWYVVKAEDGRFYNARIKGVFKIDDITSTNPIAVGDIVGISPEPGTDNSAMIDEITPRKNYINRQSPSHRKQHHIVAANLDQSLLFATLKDPKTSQGFIDRFLVTCEAYHVPAIIVFNKADLYRKKEEERLEELSEMYTRIGYKVVSMSVAQNKGVVEVKELLKDKITLMSGHSGVGKSSFLNSIFPELGLKTQDVSGWSGKGMHTTTFAEMFDLPFGGSVIDTPGVREFGLVDISKQELSHYYPEMAKLITECQFNNCLHVNEPGCAVKTAVEETGEVAVDRYVSYLNILGSIDEKNY
ncbi:ribosome small subunit-dependent GTPase A [Pseudobacter ginsenosidimutans]|uniref:Small ribosomal subunit biogenesis GTPase RsgA n=1 Tax=Pseudobacter ginsenosidimutans TaxID=661488 RepID=A0A4Q7MVW9_9BACT|nr:ribosome small subunit-dependent GTPase A [Pseudobacter ginsenosidimutans]QEC41910.1 ribosome small subunit-dependent GTPase A [Pseudobacter ginsenosidimutans]RZS71263.1 ribosome biogenesis GTPase [Pseudobacter ginsenosidimutans]